MTDSRNVATLQHGEQGFVAPQALWVSGDKMFVDGNFPLREFGLGSCSIRLLRDANGRLFIDTSCHQGGFYASPASLNADRIAIDELLPAPQPFAGGKRVCDLAAYEEAYIAADEVWVHDGKRMWLNGFTLVSDKPTAETPVRIARDSYLAFNVDLHYCAGVNWADRQPQRDFMFPMQVHRRVR